MELPKHIVHKDQKTRATKDSTLRASGMSNDLIDYWGKFHDGTPSIHRPWLPYQSRITLLLSLSHLILLFRAAFRKVLLVVSLKIGFLRAQQNSLAAHGREECGLGKKGDRGSSHRNRFPKICRSCLSLLLTLLPCKLSKMTRGNDEGNHSVSGL